MLLLINDNRMRPAIAPVGLDYVATAARDAGLPAHVVDLGLSSAPDRDLDHAFAHDTPRLVGITFRNVDDCFWPSATTFIPELERLLARIRARTDAPIVLGGVGFSVFAAQLVRQVGADFGIRGDGELALVALYRALGDTDALVRVEGLIWRPSATSSWVENAPAWPAQLQVPTSRDAIDNRAYFARGGQLGIETKRGCPRACTYCADPLAKGPRARLRAPAEVAEEFASVAAQGIDVVHLCDGEFNVPRSHALEVCHELIRRGLPRRVRWYTYATPTPFDAELAGAMRAAGCTGIDFTGDSAAPLMLERYGHVHRGSDLEQAVRLCRAHGLVCMVDLLLGGPGETPATVATSIEALRRIAPDCVGASLGLRLYPGTAIVKAVLDEGPPDRNPSIRRKYSGKIDLLQPTFYVSQALGPRPAELVRDLVGGDRRFFPPADDAAGHADGDHNYNDNAPLERAIAEGARGAFWDILRQLPATANC